MYVLESISMFHFTSKLMLKIISTNPARADFFPPDSRLQTTCIVNNYNSFLPQKIIATKQNMSSNDKNPLIAAVITYRNERQSF